MTFNERENSNIGATATVTATVPATPIQGQRNKLHRSSSIPELQEQMDLSLLRDQVPVGSDVDLVSVGLVSRSPFLLNPPSTPVQPIKPHIAHFSHHTPTGSYHGRGGTGAGSATPTATATATGIASGSSHSHSHPHPHAQHGRRHSVALGAPMTPSSFSRGPSTPSSTSTSVTLSAKGGASRRRLSTNLLSKLSIFEAGIASSLHSRTSEPHPGTPAHAPTPTTSSTSTGDAAADTDLHHAATSTSTSLHDPLEVSPLSRSRRLQRPDSLASKIIQQLNEKVQSPKKLNKLYSPRQVKQLIKSKGGSNHFKQYLSESLHTNSGSAGPQDYWEDDNEFANDAQLSPYRDAPISLSPQEVRALIESNAKAKLFHEQFIVSQLPTVVHVSSSQDLSLPGPSSQQVIQNANADADAIVAVDADQPLSQVQEQSQNIVLPQHNLDAAKSRQRKFQTDLSSSIVESKRPLPPEPPATASRVLAAATTDTEATHKSIRNQTLDIANFVPAQYPKTEEQQAFIQAKVQQLFVFSELQGQSLNTLVEAFEPVAIQHQPPHQTDTDTDTQTDNAKGNDNNNDNAKGNDKDCQIQEEGDQQHFYIVHEGQVQILVDGIKVAEAGKGDCFGEQALLHQPSRANTTLKAADEQGAFLMRLDQQSFRGILQSHHTQALESKRAILQKVDFLKPLLKQDDQLLNRLVSLMIRQDFIMDQEIVTDEEKSFIIVDQGIVDVASASGSLKLTLEPGDYFGERALLGTLPKKATGKVTMKGASSEGGVLYSMDRGEVELVLGQDRLQQLYDLNNLVKSSRLETFIDTTHTSLADHIQRKEFEEGQDILQGESPDEPSVYIVREGTALVTYTDSEGHVLEKSVGVGETFGLEHVTSSDTPIELAHRPEGCKYSAVGKDGPIALGVLPLKELQREHDHQVQEHDEQVERELVHVDEQEQADDQNSTINQAEKKPKKSNAADTGIVETASHRLQQKIRQGVKNNIGLDDLEKISVLGEGQFGEVWLVAADVFQTGVDSMKQRFALKSQKREDDIRGEDAAEAIRQEIQILESLTQNAPHPGIMHLVNTYEDDSFIYMLMGLIPGGELWSRIHVEDTEGNWTSGMNEEHAKFYSYLVADALGFMHSHGIIFRDLKPENIMLDDDGYPVIVDFGFAKLVPPGEKTFTFCGTPNYVAPEIILHTGHDKAVDYWALGVTIYEMVAGENPFYYDGLDRVTMYDTICNDAFYAYPKEITPELLDLTYKLLEKKPGKRLGSFVGGVNDIFSHKWFAGFDLTMYRRKQVKAPWKVHGDVSQELDEEAMEEVMASFMPDPGAGDMPGFHSSFLICDVAFNTSLNFQGIEEERSEDCEFHSYLDRDESNNQDDLSLTEVDVEHEDEDDPDTTRTDEPIGLSTSASNIPLVESQDVSFESQSDTDSKGIVSPMVPGGTKPFSFSEQPERHEVSATGSLSGSDSAGQLSLSERSDAALDDSRRNSNTDRSTRNSFQSHQSERSTVSNASISFQRTKMTRQEIAKSKMARRTTIKGALAHLGLDDDDDIMDKNFFML